MNYMLNQEKGQFARRIFLFLGKYRFRVGNERFQFDLASKEHRFLFLRCWSFFYFNFILIFSIYINRTGKNRLVKCQFLRKKVSFVEIGPVLNLNYHQAATSSFTRGNYLLHSVRTFVSEPTRSVYKLCINPPEEMITSDIGFIVVAS